MGEIKAYFDNHCYSLGFNAFVFITSGFTDYLSCIRNLTALVVR
jgi:hypothetical protein